MLNVFWVGCGGFLGAVSRYLLAAGVMRWLAYPLFPFGTLLVNVVGCFCIGVFVSYAEARHWLPESLRLFLSVGLLGGFTTFSSFAYETFNLGQEGHFSALLVNMGLQLGLGLLAVYLGLICMRELL